jgi:hypothetical protein
MGRAFCFENNNSFITNNIQIMSIFLQTVDSQKDTVLKPKTLIQWVQDEIIHLANKTGCCYLFT